MVMAALGYWLLRASSLLLVLLEARGCLRNRGLYVGGFKTVQLRYY